MPRGEARGAAIQTPPAQRHYETDLQRFTLGVTISGLFFGAMPWIAFHTDNGFLLSVVLMGSIGMASGGTRTLTPIPRANNLYILYILVPLAIRYVAMWNGPASWPMSSISARNPPKR